VRNGAPTRTVKLQFKSPKERSHRLASRRAAAVALAWAGLILVVTLRPFSPDPSHFKYLFCFTCGRWGVTMAVLNSLMFLPLGVALWKSFERPWPVLATTILLSVGIELGQAFVPGRFPSLGDILFNTLGGCLGLGIGMLLSRASRRQRQAARPD
jgi:VanZ like family